MRTALTFCRICEAHCGLEVTVDDDRVVAVRPDKAHPVSRGYACVKGAALGELHHDRDRINHPMKRTATGFERVSWRRAITEIGAKIRRLRRRHGRRSAAMYTGNPTYFSFQNVLFSQAFMEALGSPNLFASHSIDVNNKLFVATRMYGLSLVHPVPDFKHLKFFMCLGSNPVVSQMSVLQLPHAPATLQDVERRGGRVVMVDPRRTETAKMVGEHVAIRPGTDAYLLAAMLHIVGLEGEIDRPRVESVATGLDAFLEAARAFPPERVESITGIDAATIRELATSYAAADGAALYMSTGVNMGPFGSIAYWLLQGLGLITGNLDRRGGLLVPPGPFDVLKLTQVMGLAGEDRHRTLVHGLRRVAGAFPVSALAEEIRAEHPERIRALFVSAGNPLRSVPGHDLVPALAELDLLVVIDLYRSETAEHADYLLPATDMLERSDYPISWAVLQATPHAQYTEAVVPPAFERREEWRILSDLAIACGARAFGKSVLNALPRLNLILRRLPGLGEITPDHLLATLLRWGGKVSLKQLRRDARGVALPATLPNSFLGCRVATPDGKVRLAPEALLSDLPRLESSAERFTREDDRLLLIGRRERRSHNSWLHVSPRRNKRTEASPGGRSNRQPPAPVALMHPEDAARRDIEDGAEIEVASGTGRLRLPVRLTEDVTRGAISIPFCRGHRRSGATGGNVNEVIPGGVEQIELISGQAVMSAHRVTVKLACR